MDAETRRVSDHVVNVLARVTANAKAGSVQAVMIITVSPTAAAEVQFGGDVDYLPSINLGLDMAKHTLLTRVIEAPGATRMNSGLIRPGDVAGHG